MDILRSYLVALVGFNAKLGNHNVPGLVAFLLARDQCQAQKVAFFFKQWGGPRPKSGGRELDGREWSEFPQAKTA